MGGNGGLSRRTGRNTGSGIIRGSGGGGGISIVDACIKWDKTAPTTYPPASVNGVSVWPGVLAIGC